MPAEDRVRRHDDRDLREQPATELVSSFGKTSPLPVVEPQAPGEPGLQQAILFAQERVDVGLLAIEPAAQDRDQQLEDGRYFFWNIRTLTCTVAVSSPIGCTGNL